LVGFRCCLAMCSFGSLLLQIRELKYLKQRREKWGVFGLFSRNAGTLEQTQHVPTEHFI